MKVKVAEKLPTSLQDLKDKICKVWALETSPEACRKLAESMPARIEAVIQNDGWPSKY